MAARSTVFSPSSLRWIANEGYEFKYLFGNTKFASFLPDRIEKKALRFCFLGFGDVRNVLGTIASIPSRSPVKRADFHLVDWHAHNVARGVLFAYLLPRISGEDDLALLWTVMYCTAMPPEMHSQLIEHIDNLLHLLENEPEMYLLHPQRDLSKVCELLAAWKDGLSIPRLQKVLQDRRVVMEKHFAMSRPDVTFDRAVMVLARKFALEIIEDHNLDSSFIGPRAKDQITKELLKYYEYGSVFPYKDDNDAEVSPDLVTNPTFLSPDLDGVWRWSLHYASHPVAGYIPFKKEVSVRLLQRPNKQKKIFKESFKQLQELVTKYRTFYKQNKINLRFSCCEALELIYSGQLERRSYDVVDTSNLADHVGYLNLLIACPSLLVPSPTSRLFTSSMIWQTGTERSHGEYLKTVLGAGPAFYPSLFGVRLIDDIAWGRDQLASMLSTMVGASHNDVDMLRWMPTPESDLQNSYVRLEDEDNKLSISLAQKEKSDYSGRGQTLTMAIRSVAATCFKSLVALTQIEKCTARTRPSSLSMLYFVCNLCERGRIAIPSDVFMDEASPLMPLWQRLADYFAGLLCIPKIWKRQWDAVCYWAFGSGGPTPLGWKGNFTMSSATELALGNGKRWGQCLDRVIL